MNFAQEILLAVMAVAVFQKDRAGPAIHQLDAADIIALMTEVVFKTQGALMNVLVLEKLLAAVAAAKKLADIMMLIFVWNGLL